MHYVRLCITPNVLNDLLLNQNLTVFVHLVQQLTATVILTETNDDCISINILSYKQCVINVRKCLPFTNKMNKNNRNSSNCDSFIQSLLFLFQCMNSWRIQSINVCMTGIWRVQLSIIISRHINHIIK